jgi:hypothetical protein
LILRKKQILGYNQAQLNLLGFAKDLGAYFGTVAGLAINIIAIWGLLSLGSIQSLLGYDALWLVLSGRITPPPYWLVSKKERKKERNLKEITHIYVVQQQLLFLFLFLTSAYKLIHQLGSSYSSYL